MKKIIITFLLLTVLVLAGYCTWQRFDRGEENKAEPTVSVQVAPIVRKDISQKLIAYGSVVAQPGKTHSVSVAFETRVRHILVAPGQFVDEGEPLTEVEPSAAAQVQVQQARTAAETAQRALTQTQQRFQLKLATNQELDAAKKAATDARTQLDAFAHAGADGDHLVRSDASGIVGKVDVQDGQVVPVGSPLVEIVAENEIEVKLGVEPENLPALHQNQPITIFPVDNQGQGKVDGAARLITRRVDPTTRLVDVYVALLGDKKMMLDGFVRAEFARTAKNVLVVPRAAVLPNEQKQFQLFTVENGHAKKHTVAIGLENATEVEVTAPELRAGEPVVTVGNYELAAGMPVEVQKTR